MGFFSHAMMLGVGYWIGKSYCFRYKVHQLPNEPDSSEILLRVERKDGGYPFWGHPWWNHHHHCHGYYPRHPEGSAPSAPMHEKKSNPELLEVETK